MVSLRLFFLAAVVSLLAACGGSGDRTTTDAGAHDSGGGVDAGGGPTAPMAPAPPDGVHCPDGLLAATTGSGVPTCDRDPGEPACDAASVRFYDTAICSTVGPPCPAGDFPDTDPPGTVVHVLASAAPGGDGSRALPYATIAEGLSHAISGTTVLVGKGTYTEHDLQFRANVRLMGTCAGGTTITAPTGIVAPGTLVRSAAAGTKLESLTLGPSAGLAFQVEGGSLEVHGVIAVDATTVGVSVVGGMLTGDGLVVRHTRPDASFHDEGFGLFAENGATVDLDHTVFERNGDVGVLAVAGSHVTLNHVAVRDGLGAPSGGTGTAMHAEDRAEITIEGAEIVGHPHGGLDAVTNAHFVARNVTVLHDDVNLASVTDGYAIDVEDHSTFELEHAILAHGLGPGFALRDSGTLVASDVVVHDWGIGIVTQSSAVTFARTELVATSSGVSFAGPASMADLSDFAIRGTTGARDGGFGIVIAHGGTMSLARVVVASGIVTGIGANGADVTVTGSDVDVDGVASYGAMEQWGHGLDVAGGAHATLTRVRVSAAREVAVAGFGAGTVVDLTDLSITHAQPRSCAMTSCADVAGGTGLGAYDGAAVTAHGFLVDDAALCGLQVAGDSMLDATDGRVRAAAVGACVQVPAYDVARVTGTVAYESDGINVDSSDLPLPMPLDLGSISSGG